MAGHSQFKNIMHRKGAQDARKSRIFARLAREIYVAVSTGGDDPAMNSRLRLAIRSAKGESMPKENIDRAIRRAQSSETTNYESVRYEGYGPSGVAVIVECLTDNRNRTASNVRSAFSKYGGNLAETGSVSFMFDRKGEILYPLETATADALLDAALEIGAEDVESSEDHHRILCAPDELAGIASAFEARMGAPMTARWVWRPKNLTQIEDETAVQLFRLIDLLEDDDDVQSVFSNFETSGEVMDRASR